MAIGTPSLPRSPINFLSCSTECPCGGNSNSMKYRAPSGIQILVSMTPGGSSEMGCSSGGLSTSQNRTLMPPIQHSSATTKNTRQRIAGQRPCRPSIWSARIASLAVKRPAMHAAIARDTMTNCTLFTTHASLYGLPWRRRRGGSISHAVVNRPATVGIIHQRIAGEVGGRDDDSSEPIVIADRESDDDACNKGRRDLTRPEARPN
jgi:hypothetical protein